MITKRAFDIICSLVALIFTFPLWIIIAIAIKLDSKGPVFYKSKRVGVNAKCFYLYKFRSMVKDADQLGGKISAANDPRQTRVGRFIRKWKIDELPNFLNVLKGEMSIVGPRPESPEYVRYYTPEQMRVLAVRPGITDMSVCGQYRNEQQVLSEVEDPQRYYIDVILQDFLRLNLEYVEAQPSLWFDLKIIFRTIWAVLFDHRVKIKNKSYSFAQPGQE